MFVFRALTCADESEPFDLLPGVSPELAPPESFQYLHGADNRAQVVPTPRRSESPRAPGDIPITSRDPLNQTVFQEGEIVSDTTPDV